MNRRTRYRLSVIALTFLACVACGLAWLLLSSGSEPVPMQTAAFEPIPTPAPTRTSAPPYGEDEDKGQAVKIRDEAGSDDLLTCWTPVPTGEMLEQHCPTSEGHRCDRARCWPAADRKLECQGLRVGQSMEIEFNQDPTRVFTLSRTGARACGWQRWLTHEFEVEVVNANRTTWIHGCGRLIPLPDPSDDEDIVHMEFGASVSSCEVKAIRFDGQSAKLETPIKHVQAGESTRLRLPQEPYGLLPAALDASGTITHVFGWHSKSGGLRVGQVVNLVQIRGTPRIIDGYMAPLSSTITAQIDHQQVEDWTPEHAPSAPDSIRWFLDREDSPGF